MNKKIFLTAIFLIFSLNFSSANADFSSWLYEKISNIFELRENEKTNIGDFTELVKTEFAKDSVLETISSCDVLNEIIGKNERIGIYPILYRGMGIAEDMAVEKSVDGQVSNESASPDYSKTNVQVDGVDEGDIVKNDGKFIYVLANSKKSVKIFDTEKSEKFTEISFPDENFYGNEIYISEGKKLVLIGSGWEEPKNQKTEKNSKMIWNPGKNFVKIFVYDLEKLVPVPEMKKGDEVISDEKIGTGTNFQAERKIFFEGNFAKSRLIGEELFLITKKYSRDFYFYEEQKNSGEENIPEIFDFQVVPVPENQKGENKNEYENKGTGTSCSEVEFFPGSKSTDFVTVSKINLSDKNSEISKKLFLGDLENIYMSQKNLYIAAGTRGEDGNFWNWDATQIVKFGLENLELQKTGKVEGRILNQFSMDEFNGNFRIATTDRDEELEEIEEGKGDEKTTIIRQNSIPKNNLFILNEDLEQVGKIEGIAKGEQIKSVRFMGNRAFIVTFENVDPFFVLDLSDSQNPKILGELKIPGWSDYLHPFGENYILGFGKDAKDIGEGENLKWDDIGGMKISLFDITDLQNPKEKFIWKTGERGTYSEVLNDHKGLFFEENGETGAILGFHLFEKNEIKIEEKNCFEFKYSNCPINCQKRCTPTSKEFIEGDCDGPGSCIFQRFGDNLWTSFAGAVFLEISSENGFSEKKRISNFSNDEYLKDKYFWESQERKISRIVRIGEKYFGVSEDSTIEVGKDFGEEKKILIK